MAEPAVSLSIAQVNHSAAWDWENLHVNESFNIAGQSAKAIAHDIVESGTVLICSAPATLNADIGNLAGSSASTSGVRIVPIGMVEQASVQQSRPLSRIFEIGSKLSYIIPGRVVGQIALARVLFDGPSLLKCLYQGEVLSDEQLSDGTKSVKFNSSTGYSAAGSTASPNAAKTAGGTDGATGGFQPIGSGNIAMNLASSFFAQPVGLVFFFHDRQNQSVGAMYFEGCQVSSHSFGISSGMNVITESISIEFVRALPVVTHTALQDSNASASIGGILYDTPIIGMS